jgi:hypothetical protein
MMTQIIIWALVLALFGTNGGILRGSLTSDPREARPEGSQFRDQPPSREATASHRRSRLHPREFAKNSRIFAAFAPGANRAPQFSSLADQLLRPRLARDELIPLSTKGDPRL